MANKDDIGIRLAPPNTGVTVRMYHTGFGDCFLLAFRAEDGGARYMLIDCGVHHQYDGGDKRMMLVAQDIAKATGNKLHVLAVTHEHTDHLYGFMYGEATFQKFDIDELWLAWTEDPRNPTALKLKELLGSRIRALQAAIAHLKADDNSLAASLDSVLSFDLALDSATMLKGNKDILKALRSWSKKSPERPEDYRTPGEKPLEISGVKGIKCYVLGPPKDIKLIEKLVDSAEMYLKLAAMDEENSFKSAVMAASEMKNVEDDRLFNNSIPFDQSLIIQRQDAAFHSEYGNFFREHYGFTDGVGSGPEWRRIDTDWLAAADQLALNINRMTNNTSLVLAFEMTETNPPKVLLFVGDAQVGNWLSWRALEWPSDGPKGAIVTGADLLRRTVLYKVGHHGSLNATLREKGLEMMESNELVAMIPVDENWAKIRGWHHPEEKLVNRLMEKARGRVLRSDKIPGDESLIMPTESTEADWRAFLKNLEWDKSPDRLWLQYTIQ